jgi:HTH-type transcriptional regulator/antitoxin HigA
MATQYNPDYAIHPGEYLEEVLLSREIKKSELSERSGMSPKTISQIIAGKTLYSPETALVFERTLGISANIWISLLESYQLFQARAHNRKLLESPRNLEIFKRFPISDLKKLKILPDTKNHLDLLEGLFRFLGVKDFSSWNNYNSSQLALFRKSGVHQDDDYATAVWLRLARDKAERIQVNEFIKHNLESTLEKLRSLTKESLNNSISKIKDLLKDAGVALVIIPELKKTHLSGVSFWISPNKALIAMSLRHKTNDHFWFTLFHEIGHILLHSKKAIFLDSAKTSSRVSPIEKEADQFARDNLIPEYEWEKFTAQNFIRSDSVRRFSRKISIHPGIVVGRLQKEGRIPYSQLNQLKEKINPSLFENLIQ